MFKIVHGFDRLSFDDFFTLYGNSRTRGHGLKLRKNYSRLDVRKFSFLRGLLLIGIRFAGVVVLSGQCKFLQERSG